MLGETEPDDDYAITTFGMNNHGIRSDKFRYIQYEDGGEEFYDHRDDPHEWTNQIGNPDYQKEIARLKQFLPAFNAGWDSLSSYTFQPYFVEQKARTSGSEQ